MDYNKTEILRECRDLLQQINCEIVVDISDSQLFNVLFQSDVKKETLLSWLLQQMFSQNAYSKNSVEDLASTFIPKSQFRSFLIGTMPIAEQYKKWKLIMSVLRKKQKCHTSTEAKHYEENMINGTLLEKYENIWNDKFEYNPKYFNLTLEQPKKVNINELQMDLTRAKNLLSQWKSEEEPKNKDTNIEEKISDIFETYKQSTDNFNSIVTNRLLPNMNNLHDSEQFCFRYDHLNKKVIKNITKNAQILLNSIESLNNVLHGIEHFNNQN